MSGTDPACCGTAEALLRAYCTRPQASYVRGTGPHPRVCCFTVCLRACYAMSGSDLAYAAPLAAHTPASCLCVCYAMSGTDIAYGASTPAAFSAAMRR
eukprot:3756650-Rhodomonas_salina.5